MLVSILSCPSVTSDSLKRRRHCGRAKSIGRFPPGSAGVPPARAAGPQWTTRRRPAFFRAGGTPALPGARPEAAVEASGKGARRSHGRAILLNGPGGDRGVGRLHAPHRLPQVPGHHHHAGEEQHTAEEADDVERVQWLSPTFNEGVGERAVGIHCAPHQPLHDTCHPHRGDVEHDADGGDPEVHFDQALAVELVAPNSTRGSSEVDRLRRWRRRRPSPARRSARGRWSSRCSARAR